jgi:hypothetical protein
LGAFLLKHPARYIHLMIQSLIGQESIKRLDSSGFWIRSTEYQSAHPRLEKGACAHDAWFNSDIYGAIIQPVISSRQSCLSERQDLSMGGGIIHGKGSIVCASDDTLIR